MVTTLLRFFLRPKCVICGSDSRLSLHWCWACMRALRSLKRSTGSACIEYQGREAASLLSEMRGAQHRHALAFFGKRLAEKAMQQKFDYVLIAPQNRKSGGLSVFARKLASLTSAQFLPNQFSKPFKHRQHGRGAADRLNTDLFICSKRNPSLIGARILLMDDVSATGTTLAQCAHLLQEQGVQSTTSFVLARSPAKFKSEREETNKKA